MRRFHALLSATVLSLVFLLAADGYLFKKLQDRSNVIINTVAAPTSSNPAMTQETALHLIRASFRVVTPTGSGTGVAIWTGQRKSGNDRHYYNYLVTCAHVVKTNRSVIVQQFRYIGEKMIYATTSYSADVVLVDTPHDLALLEVQAEEPFKDTVSLVKPEDYKKMRLAEPVWACGCGLGNPPYVANAGNVARFAPEVIQVTSPIIFGNSGGGLYTVDGKLLGITRAIPTLHIGGVYPQAGLCVPVWTVDIWLKINNFGFLNNANDGSSLDNIFEQREKAQKELEKRLRERAAQKMLDDLLKEFDPLKGQEEPNDYRLKRRFH